MDNFIQDSLRTESSQFNDLIDNSGKVYSLNRLIHAQMGMQTETAEFTDALKKSLFYSKSLDVVNLKEELGDLMWYMAIAMDELGTDFQAESARVIKKLKTRYHDKFTSECAQCRNLAAERGILENQDT
jgi:NTP pyrophosphatase (non-canonical NTP hydrolase)